MIGKINQAGEAEFMARVDMCKRQFDGDIAHEVYLDNAATTRIDPSVVVEMERWYEIPMNPSARHYEGYEAQKVIAKSSKIIADFISATPEEIIFTSGGTESNNWAIMRGSKSNRIVIGGGEHSSVVQPAKWLEEQGFDVTVVELDSNGKVSPVKLQEVVQKGDLVSIQHANQETGIVNNIVAISQVVHAVDAYLHVDAVQSLGKIPVDVEELGVDMMSCSGHKIHGPQGIGFSYVRNGIEIAPLIFGGGQQEGRRSGTQPVALIAGLGQAVLCAEKAMESINDIVKIREFLESDLHNRLGFSVVGKDQDRLPTICKIIMRDDLEGDVICSLLDEVGFRVSQGSACESRSKEKSKILEQMGYNKSEVGSSLRVSLSRYTTREEVLFLVDALQRVGDKAAGLTV